jgi:Rrf2 family protein
MNGVRIMIDLAQHDGEGPQVARAIADRLGISVKYVDPIVQDLRKSELIASGRGRKGGYMLARPAKKINVGEIVRCLDTPYQPSDVPDDLALEAVLQDLQTAVWKVLDRTKLDKLVKKPAGRSAKSK